MAKQFKSEADLALKNRALDFLRRYQSDGETLRQFREDAMKAYRRDKDLYLEDARIPEGSRSKFIQSDVFDTIESMMPSMAQIFYSGSDVVRIEGRGPEDEEKIVGADPVTGKILTINPAALLNQKVNWDITRQNNGFLIIYDAIKTAMLEKFVAVKYWWERRDVTVAEEHQNLTDDQLNFLLEDPDFIPDEKSLKSEKVSEGQEIPLELGGGMIPATLAHSIKGKRIKERIRRPVAEVLPGEEFVCSMTMRDIKEEEFVAHRKRVHKADLMRNYELSEDDLAYEGSIFTPSDSEVYRRFHDLGGIGFFQDQQAKDFYFIYECYLKDENREPIQLILLGDRIISKEPNSYGTPPFCIGSPIRIPFRAIGMGLAELVTDFQKFRSSITRFVANNIYYQTDGMVVADGSKINLNDFATQRRPGGVIRTKSGFSGQIQDSIWPVPVQPLAGHAYGLLEAINGWRENRTGVTRYNQGADADSLNKTASGINQIMTASQQRIQLVARIFAETLIKDIMTAFAQMNIDYLDKDRDVFIKLNQEWKAVQHKDIDVKFDVTVDVALGTGSKDLRIQHMMGMLDRIMQPLMIQLGVCQPSNVYELLISLWVEMGFKNPQKFITDPSTLVPVQPPGGANALQAGGQDAVGLGVEAQADAGAGVPG